VLFAPGDAVADEVVLLVSGRLRVELDGATLAEIDQPGSFVGEVASLLRSARSATVVAVEPTTVRSPPALER
jgi:CRP-like cAMP-binding protein